MAARRRYKEELRTLGQALEAKGVTGFELYNVPSGYFVKDLREHERSFRVTLRNWLRGHAHGGTESATYAFETKDVEELSKSGRARRSNPGQVPQFRDLSNILRTIGAYLDSQEAELTELHKRPISITLEYRDRWGHEHREDRPVSSFHSLFRELFEKRGLIRTDSR